MKFFSVLFCMCLKVIAVCSNIDYDKKLLIPHTTHAVEMNAVPENQTAHNKEIIEAIKKKIYDEVESTKSNLMYSNLTNRFNQMKQDSLKEFDEKTQGGNKTFARFRDQLNHDLNDFNISLATTMQAYAQCIRNYTDLMQKSLDTGDYYEQRELEKLHENATEKAISQFVTDAQDNLQIIHDIKAAIQRNVKKTIKEKFRYFIESNNEKRKKIIGKINEQNSIICDRIKVELKENITRDIENTDLNSGISDLDNLYNRSKEAAMKEFDMRKSGNDDISKSLREKLDTDLNDFRKNLFETMTKYQNYFDQYNNVMSNVINSSASFLNENQLTDTHDKAKNESVSEFLAKSKLGHDELSLRFKQKLEKGIADKFLTFAGKNEAKKQDFLANENLYKEIIEVTKMKIYNNICSELFDLLESTLADRFKQIQQDSMNEFDSKKRGQNVITSGFHEKLNQDLNDLHSSLAKTLQNYRQCMELMSEQSIDTKMECRDFATNFGELNFGCTNINKMKQLKKD